MVPVLVFASIAAVIAWSNGLRGWAVGIALIAVVGCAVTCSA